MDILGVYKNLLSKESKIEIYNFVKESIKNNSLSEPKGIMKKITIPMDITVFIDPNNFEWLLE